MKKQVATELNYKYNTDDIVICTNVSPQNHERLVVGNRYLVCGKQIFDNNHIYAVLGTDCTGFKTLIFTMDRFRKRNWFEKYIENLRRKK